MARRLGLAGRGACDHGRLLRRLGGLARVLGLLLGGGSDLGEPARLLATALGVFRGARRGRLGADRAALDLAHALLDACDLGVHARPQVGRALDRLLHLGGAAEQALALRACGGRGLLCTPQLLVERRHGALGAAGMGLGRGHRLAGAVRVGLDGRDDLARLARVLLDRVERLLGALRALLDGFRGLARCKHLRLHAGERLVGALGALLDAGDALGRPARLGLGRGGGLLGA